MGNLELWLYKPSEIFEKKNTEKLTFVKLFVHSKKSPPSSGFSQMWAPNVPKTPELNQEKSLMSNSLLQTAFHFARAKCHGLICTKVFPKVIDEQNFKPHATGLHRPTADVVNVSSAKPGNW